MKKYTHSLKAKVITFVILMLLSVFAIINFIGICYVEHIGIYNGVNSYYDTTVCHGIACSLVDNVSKDYEEYLHNHVQDDKKYFIEKYSPDKSNLRFSIAKKETPDIIEYSNYNDNENELIGYENKLEVDDNIISLKVIDPITAKDEFYDDYQLFNVMYSLRYALFIFLAIAIILITADITFLFFIAGRRQGSDEIHMTVFDKIPFDIIIILGLIVVYLIYNLFYFNIYYIYNLFAYDYYLLFVMNTKDVIITINTLLFLESVLLITALSFAVRIKKGIFIKQLIIGKIIKAINKGLKSKGYPLNGVLIILGVPLVNLLLILMTSWRNNLFYVFLLFVFDSLVLALALFSSSQMNKLINFAKNMANGDFESKLNVENMNFHYKKHAENLNEISNGMNIAIEERMKSEHLKTELITNVSHDIKTPLTSIINYVDLIKQEETDNENIEKYIAVVDKQAIRLKKLLEDLMDVSKASTGNITVENTPCKLNVLLGQVVGEYKEKLEKEGLELIINEVEEPLTILGDGRHLWRIFDNLLNNICKYAQEKTRVYLSLEKQDDKAVITFRNISSYPLNITSEELMERFVRGDKSRHSKGSGLGLSIAKSLMDLQKGTMDILIDGDLFKVILSFNIVLFDE